jgi:hypothetical protein
MTFFRNYRFPVVFTRAANVFGPGQQLYRIIPRTALYVLTRTPTPTPRRRAFGPLVHPHPRRLRRHPAHRPPAVPRARSTTSPPASPTPSARSSKSSAANSASISPGRRRNRGRPTRARMPPTCSTAPRPAQTLGWNDAIDVRTGRRRNHRLGEAQHLGRPSPPTSSTTIHKP